MSLQFRCPSCQTVIQAADSSAGQRVKCPSCGAIMQAPGAAPSGAPAPSQPNPFGSPGQGGSAQGAGGFPPSGQGFPQGGQGFPQGGQGFPQGGPQMPPGGGFGGGPQPGGNFGPRNPNMGGPNRGGGSGYNPLKAPAMALLCFCVFMIVAIIYSLVQDFIRYSNGIPLINPNNQFAAKMTQESILISRIAMSTIMIGAQSFMIYGCVCMSKLEKRGISITTLVMSLIPCLCSPCFVMGVPFGIWGLIAQGNVRFRS